MLFIYYFYKYDLLISKWHCDTTFIYIIIHCIKIFTACDIVKYLYIMLLFIYVII